MCDGRRKMDEEIKIVGKNLIFRLIIWKFREFFLSLQRNNLKVKKWLSNITYE